MLWGSYDYNLAEICWVFLSWAGVLDDVLGCLGPECKVQFLFHNSISCSSVLRTEVQKHMSPYSQWDVCHAVFLYNESSQQLLMSQEIELFVVLPYDKIISPNLLVQPNHQAQIKNGLSILAIMSMDNSKL